MTLELSEVCDWLGAASPPHAATVRGYSIDSRTLQPGDLFFAIQGELRDGHDFVGDALGRGASAAVVRESHTGGGPVVRVPDTSAALARLAARVRRRWGRPVVAVTGSAGKTTTKDAAASLLEGFFRVAKSEGNLNNQYGLPLSLLRVPARADLAVVEIGINRPGEMRPLARIAQPDVAVVTNVGTAHVGNFGSADGIAAEKGRLVEELPEDGTAVLNADDARVAGFRRRTHAQVLTYGTGPDAQLRAEGIEDRGPEGVRFRLGGCTFASPLAGRHNVYNILAAVGVASALGIAVRRLRAAVAALRPVPMRGAVRKVGGVTLIDDCYNASPPAMRAMLGVLARADASRRIAVLGEMRELGARSGELHRQVGRAVRSAAVDYLVAVGGRAADIAEAARVPSEFHESPLEAGAALASLLRPGDVVLFKASRAVGLERARDAVSQCLALRETEAA